MVAVAVADVPVGEVPVLLKLYTSSKFGPPQYSEKLPLHSWEQELRAAGVPPLTIWLPHPKLIIRFAARKCRKNSLQHCDAYSAPARVYPAVWHAARQRSTVMTDEPPVVETALGRARPVEPSLHSC